MFFKNFTVKVLSVTLAVLISFGSLTGVAIAASSTAHIELNMQKTVEEAEITADDLKNKIVAVARAEEGFVESSINKFTQWYYGRETESAWCTIFVSWCAANAGAIGTAIPRRNTCSSMKRWFQMLKKSELEAPE